MIRSTNVASEGDPQAPVGLIQPSTRFRQINPVPSHDHCVFDPEVCGIEKSRCLFVTRAAEFHHQTLRPLDELLARRGDVHHEVLVSLAPPDHRRGGDHREQHFLGERSLHACAPRDRFRPGHDLDDVVGNAKFFHLVADEERRPCASGAGLTERGDHEGSAAARRYPEDDIVFTHVGVGHGRSAILFPVLDPLGTAHERGMAARDQAGDERRIRTVGRGTFGSVQDTEATGCARSDVEQAPTVPECLDDMIHHHRDVIEALGNPVEYRAIFGMNEIEYLAGAREIDGARTRVPRLRAEALKQFEEGAVVQVSTPGSTAPPGTVIA